MRVSVLVLGFLLAGGTSTALAQGYSAGVKAGVNFANLNFEFEDGDDTDFDNRKGLVAGLFIVWPVSGGFGVQTEALYSQKGAAFGEEGGSGRIELDYLDVPILARYSTPPASNATSLHVFAGPSLGFRLRARSEAEFDGETEDDDIGDDVERFDLGLVAGAGIELGRVVIDGRYAWGLSNVNALDDGVKIKNRVFSIMAGVKF